jgi:hypothetical protein
MRSDSEYSLRRYESTNSIGAVARPTDPGVAFVRSRSRHRIAWIAGGAVGLLSALAIARIPASSPPEATVHAASQTGSVRVGITAFPAGAKLYLDGMELSDNPHVATLPPDGVERRLRIEAPGHVSEERSIYVEGPAEIVVHLTPDPSATAPREKAPPQYPAHTGAAARSVRGPVVNPNPCAVPYRFDNRGIKRYKPACL